MFAQKFSLALFLNTRLQHDHFLPVTIFQWQKGPMASLDVTRQTASEPATSRVRGSPGQTARRGPGIPQLWLRNKGKTTGFWAWWAWWTTGFLRYRSDQISHLIWYSDIYCSSVMSPLAHNRIIIFMIIHAIDVFCVVTLFPHPAL